MTETEQVRRAEKAKAILESPLWLEAWDSYRKALITLMEKADSNDTEVVMQAKRLLAASQNARHHLEMLIRDGKMASAILEQEENRKRRPNGVRMGN